MKIHPVTQGTPQWLALRSQYPTASEFKHLVSPAELKPCKGKTVAKYIAKKVAEAWLGAPLQSFLSTAMDQGKVIEEEARPWYAFRYEAEIDTPGFVTNDADTAGCSPDGLIVGSKRGLEIKGGEADTHVEWILAGGLPQEHLLQVQGSLWVCGYDEWYFVSYLAVTPRFPQHVVRVKPDRNVHDAIEEAVGLFWERFDEGWARLLDANGGEEPKRDYDVTYDADGSMVKTLRMPEMGGALTEKDFDEFMAGAEPPQDQRAKDVRTILQEGGIK